MCQHKKRFSKWITLVHALQKVDEKQTFQREMVAKEKGNLLSIKGPNKKENLEQLAACHVKFLKDGLPKDGVEGICDIHL
jgi:hypothetical protein